jgi:hypothetical protein
VSVLSKFLSHDALAAAVVAVVMASPAAAAARQPTPHATAAPKAQVLPGTAKAAKQDPLKLRVAAQQREEEARLVGMRKAYDGLAATRDQLHEGTRACMGDQRWFLKKVSDALYDDGQVPSASYLEGALGHATRAVTTRRVQLGASRMATSAPAPATDASTAPSREAARAVRTDLDRLNASVDRLNALRTSCLDWSERTTVEVSAAIGAPATTRLNRFRAARAAAERDYRSMQDITPDSAANALAAMTLAPDAPPMRMGSL